MSENLFQLFTTQFSTVLEMKLQQTVSKLRGRVSEGYYVGKQASPVQYMQPIKMQTPKGRFAPIGRVDTSFERRWIFPADRDLPQLIDTFDELRTIVDPKSQYSSNAAAAVAREWDDIIIACAFADAKIGTDVDGLTSETFDTSKYQIAATFGSGSTESGLTVAKLREIKRLYRKNHVDLETDPITMIVGSQQESDLLDQVEIISKEFNDKPVMVDGKVTRFLGIDFVYSERLGWDSANNRRKCIATTKSGLHLGVWKDTVNDVSQRKDLSGQPYQLYTYMTSGATRLQAGRVLQVLCADSTGLDITP